MKNLFISGITGKVGKLLSSYALESNHFKLVGGSCSPDNNFFKEDVGTLLEIDQTGIQISEKVSEDLGVDIIIDFSSPSSAMKILRFAKRKKIPILIGTTGLSEDDFKEIEIASNQIPVLFAPNTSSGIAILKNILNKYNVIIGMYHDQVLAPIKTLYNFDAINITLGLPILRISPDHGPNFEMLGKNKSNSKSLSESIRFLDKIK